jgi:ribonuclease HII
MLKGVQKISLLPFVQAGRLEAGCDEAGRGCLAGPVFAAAVILPEGFSHPDLNDSKQMTLKKRDRVRIVIEQSALAWSVASADAREIDEINILNASILAMHRAISGLKTEPDFLLIDGHRFKPFRGIPHQCEIKGDGRFMSIAAASVLAKTHRDEFMLKIYQEYPAYHWDHNMGYPTRLHRDAIREHGISPYHRRSFRLLDEQLIIPFKSDD